MKKTIILYGLAMAVFIFLLKYLEYRLLIHDLSTEIYVGIIAIAFTILGIWAGLRITRKKVIVTGDFIFNENELQRLGISKREYEVLELVAKGFSNQEIADKLFVSLNTVKTHSSNLFMKLDARR